MISPYLNFHLPTLLLALVMGCLLLGLVLLEAQRGAARNPALRLWTLSAWAFLTGFSLLALRPWITLALSVVGGNGMITLGATFATAAIHRFVLERNLPGWIWALAALSLLAPLVMLDWPLHQRVSVMSLLLVALLAPSLNLMLRRGRHTARALRIVAASMCLACVALLVRAVHAGLVPAAYSELLQPGLGQGLTYLCAFISLLGAGFGFQAASLELSAQRMSHLAAHDDLTGCVNRGTADTLLEHALQRGKREGTPLAIALLDIDHFKQVNDRHGHRTGDAVLQAFARTVRARLRASDVLGRVGGEEFLMLLPATDLAGAKRVCEDVRANIATMSVAAGNGSPVNITVSGGIAVAASDSGLNGDRLYGWADRALYRAKDQGRNRIAIASDETAGAAQR